MLVLVIIFHRFCQKRVYSKSKELLQNVEPLPDVGHSLLEKISKNRKLFTIMCTKNYGVCDVLTMALIVIALFYLLRNRQIGILSDVFLVISILFFVRSIMFNLTLLPDPSPGPCKMTLFFGGCNDLIYSGHSVLLTISLYILLIKANIGNIGKCIYTTMYMLALFTILACKNHYTVDIIISVMLSTLLSKHMIS